MLQVDAHAWSQPLAANQALPGRRLGARRDAIGARQLDRVRGGVRPQQEDLDRAARLLDAMQPRGDHPAVVAHQQVARTQILRDIGKGPVRQAARRAIDDQEPGCIARLDWRLCDQLGREDVIELTRLHQSACSKRPGCSAVSG